MPESECQFLSQACAFILSQGPCNTGVLGTLCLRYVAATHITSIYFEVQILLLLFQLVNPQMSPKFKHVVFCLENWAQEGKIPPVLDGLTLTHRGIYSCTGKSLSEALFFAEHGENMLCT